MRVTYVLAREFDGETVYWRGIVDDRGTPRWTLWRHEARHFSSPRCAYEAAATHPKMNPDEWRAIPAAPLLKDFRR